MSDFACRLPRRLLCGAVLAALPAVAVAQSAAYPSKPVRLIVAFAPGGLIDSTGRMVGQALTERMGQPFVVENRTGATGTIAAELVARAPPDGHTLFVANPPTNVVAPHMYARVGYDPIKDFAAVVRMVHNPLLVVVHPSLPVKSVGELIALAKAKPGQLNFATGGMGSTPHLTMELFKRMAKIDTMAIHYKGEGAALVEAIGGHVHFMAVSISVLLPYVRGGKLRGIAVTTTKRSSLAPEFPTVAETGLRGFDTNTWSGIVAPAATPRDIIQRLNSEIVQWLSQPNTKTQLVKMGLEIVADTPEQFSAFLKDEYAKWGNVVKELNLRAE
jgi:tripartite-type tricarboxylate transporter receptor subunit TctC